MATKLFVGNLHFDTTEQELRSLFSDFRPIYSAKLIKDRSTGKARGFGFIELEGQNISNAIEHLNGTLLRGRKIRINRAFKRKSTKKTSEKSYSYRS